MPHDIIKFKAQAKVLVIGPPGAGKSTLLERLETGIFSDKTMPSAGIDFKVKIFDFGEDNNVRLTVYEAPGSWSFNPLTKLYLERSDFVIVAIDLSDKTNFKKSFKEWFDGLAVIRDELSKQEHSLTTIFVGTKADLPAAAHLKKVFSPEELENLKHDFIQPVSNYFVCSAKDGTGLEEILHFMAQRELEHVLTEEMPAAEKQEVKHGAFFGKGDIRSSSLEQKQFAQIYSGASPAPGGEASNSG